MAIEFGCTSCQQLVRVGDAAAGKRGKCPHCGTILQIPAASAPAVAAPAPSYAAPSYPAQRPPAAVQKPAGGSLSFPCPGCGKTMKAPAAMAGKRGKCPHCQTTLVIGGGQSAAAPLATPSPGDLMPLGQGDLMPLDDGLAPLGGGFGGDLFASLPPLEARVLPSGPALNPLGAAPSDWSAPPPGPAALHPYAPSSPFASSSVGHYAPSHIAPVKLMIPAICLIFFSVISIGWMGITGLGGLLTPMPPPPPELDEAGRAGYQVGYYAAAIGFPLVSVLVNIGVIAGAIQMIRLKGFDLAKGGAIAAIVPCSPLCCVSMPVGIWALIVLNQPDVRRQFG